MSRKIAYKGQPKQTQRLSGSIPVQVTIDQEHEEQVVQYEFYIPAKVWDHRAVKGFRANLGTISIGATIFKGTTGIWKSAKEGAGEVVEDTHIYRLVKGDIPESTDYKGEDDKPMSSGKDAIRAQLRGFIEQMMLELSVWDESKQEEFLFTETGISSNRAELK